MWSQILWLANPYATAHIPRSHQDRHIDQQSTTGHLAQSSLSTIKQTVVFYLFHTLGKSLGDANGQVVLTFKYFMVWLFKWNFSSGVIAR